MRLTDDVRDDALTWKWRSEMTQPHALTATEIDARDSTSEQLTDVDDDVENETAASQRPATDCVWRTHAPPDRPYVHMD